MTTVLYRGPFQGRRVRFLLDALAEARTPVDFVWLNPGYRADGSREVVAKLRAERPFVARSEEVDGSWRAFPAVVRMLRRTMPAHDDVMGIGFTSLAYARAVRPAHLVWAVNGIPEERLLYDSSARSKALVAAMWWAARIGPRPDLTVVVSAPMGRLVERRMPGSRWAKAPTSVDREIFRPPAVAARSTMTYVGSGAPWQGVDVLAPIWRELHRRDPDLRFLVVSRDERARALLHGIPDSHATMTAAETPAAVAAELARSELAFLVRLPDVVNEASFPTKFGEYVASGVPVVTTDVGWDVADIIRQTGAGVLVDPFGDPVATAEEILRFRARVAADPAATRVACRLAADEMSRERWLASLSAELVSVLGTPAGRDHARGALSGPRERESRSNVVWLRSPPVASRWRVPPRWPAPRGRRAGARTARGGGGGRRAPRRGDALARATRRPPSPVAWRPATTSPAAGNPRIPRRRATSSARCCTMPR